LPVSPGISDNSPALENLLHLFGGLPWFGFGFRLAGHHEVLSTQRLALFGVSVDVVKQGTDTGGLIVCEFLRLFMTLY